MLLDLNTAKFFVFVDRLFTIIKILIPRLDIKLLLQIKL
jgi:hypothetical protein